MKTCFFLFLCLTSGFSLAQITTNATTSPAVPLDPTARPLPRGNTAFPQDSTIFPEQQQQQLEDTNRNNFAGGAMGGAYPQDSFDPPITNQPNSSFPGTAVPGVPPTTTTPARPVGP